MRKQTVLLTGASGFIGSHLLRLFLRSYNVVTIGRTPVPGVSHIQFDLARSAGQPIASQIPAGAILVHAGAAVRRSANDDLNPGQFGRVNVEGTRRLLDALAKRQPSHIVFISTADVYSPSADMISETSPEGPQTPYAESKLQTEHLVQSFGVDHGTVTSVLRLGSIYGPGEEAFGKLVPTAIRAALARQPITVIGTGSARRDLLFVGDAVRAVGTVVRLKCPGKFNAVSGVAVSVIDIVNWITSLTKNAAGLRFVPSSGQQADRTFLRSRLEDLGWSPRVSLQVGLKREIAAAQNAKPLLAIDLDGTLLDHWQRMYQPYRAYFSVRGLPVLSIGAYKKAKRSGASEEDTAAKSLGKDEVQAYLSWKRKRIEGWSLLSTDRLSEAAHEFLRTLNARFRVALVTGRHQPRLLRRQLELLSILGNFEEVVAVSDSDPLAGKAEALRQLQERAKNELWYIADTGLDIVAARRAGVHVAAVCWGLRCDAVLRKYSPDRLIRRPWNGRRPIPLAFGR
jgi:nucleoside-diphosphate-sugar epimerase/beta-phosphoglucomutase-like phosphatase (HAD superfamily)